MSETKTVKLKICPNRENKPELENATGIFIRAEDSNGKFGSFDIAQLDKESLLAWLKSRGGDNSYAEDTVGILLGHGHLHEIN